MSARSKSGIILLFLVLGLPCTSMNSAVSGAPWTLLAASAEARTKLSTDPIRVPLVPSTQSSTGKDPALEAMVGQRVYLVLDGISAELSAGVSYDVFLGPPDSSTPAHDDEGYAGTLNFFDIPAEGSGQPHSVSYDVTDAVMHLRQHGRLRSPLVVTFVPVAPPLEKTEPTIARISLVAQ